MVVGTVTAMAVAGCDGILMTFWTLRSARLSYIVPVYYITFFFLDSLVCVGNSMENDYI